MEIISIALALAFIGYAFGREFLAYRERKDFLDRLMAKDLPEYKNETVEEPEPKEEPETVVELEDAQEEINGQEEN